MQKTITHGAHTKEYTLEKKDRKTLRLTVKPDLSIILSCPLEASEERIEKFLKRKWKWMDQQIAFFQKYQKKTYKKEYVSGESFYYLGRQYKLVVKKTQEDKVALSQGKLYVYTSKKDSNHIQSIVENWYKEKAKNVFKQRFDELHTAFGYNKKLILRTAAMKRKWGSFKDTTITLNPILIQASKDSIDYVITHELCHVRYKNHDKKFWSLMDEMYPGWEKVKEKLEIKFG